MPFGTSSQTAAITESLSKLHQAKGTSPSAHHAFRPFAAPSYWQQNGYWCNLNAITDCVQCHVGSWPAGGRGSRWGETTPWYLAGKAGQRNSQGYFWGETLKKAGVLDAAVNLEQEVWRDGVFRNEHFECRHWEFGSSNPAEWGERWIRFQSYVESVLDGTWESGRDPRPVVVGAWHTRLLTGSDGTNAYLNDPAGGHFEVMSWEGMKDYVKNERVAAYGTLVFLAPVKGAEQRRGAICLQEAESRNREGSLTLFRPSTGYTASCYHWDGRTGRPEGHFFDDLGLTDSRRQQPLLADPRYGHAFNPRPDDVLRYNLSIQNLTFTLLSYEVVIDALELDSPDSDTGAIAMTTRHNVTVNGRTGAVPAENPLTELRGQLAFGTLRSGPHCLRISLFQGGVLQDRKWVGFTVAHNERQVYAVSPSALGDINGQLVPDGAQMSLIHVATDGDNLNLTVTWTAGDNNTLIFSQPQAEFRSTYQRLWDEGFRLHALDACVTRGQPEYSAIFRPGKQDEIQVYDWPLADLRRKYDGLWRQGFRVDVLDAYVLNGEARFFAVWHPSEADEIQAYDWPLEEVRREYDRLWPEGWRLHILNTYVVGQTPRYIAVWRKSNDAEVQIYGWTLEALKAKYDELWAAGWRLHIINSFAIEAGVRYNAVWRKGRAS